MGFGYKNKLHVQKQDIPPDVVKAVEFQINKEIYSQYLYNSMGAYLQCSDLPGMAKWMFKQAREEEEHAFKLIEWLTLKGQRVHLAQIDEPIPQWWDSPQAVFENSLEHEKLVTSLIHSMGEKILPFDKDHPELGIQALVQWFIDEQVEEEESVGKIVQIFVDGKSSNRSMSDIDIEIGNIQHTC
ncbi:putative ferritin [Blattamonas nauphoetae]|uniref:Ferritin n=1 Tax=Blattamonas nauphoetae TaxID=2049346 RepID=A0ABQ9XWG7_9EUKA|nr:putative ferritin [Blattamonas nauphoetae]